jgi:Uma2 family endonuclease
MSVSVLNLKPFIDLTNDQFYELCQNHRDLRFERNAAGEIIIMSPTGGETGNRNFSLTVQFGNWVNNDATGLGFDSSTGFKLLNGADRSPDLSWVKLSRWNALTPDQQRKFPPIAPDFILELRSQTDDLKPLQDKMQEYIDNGVRLGLLLNPQDRQVEIHRPNQPIQILNQPQQIDCNPELPGFILNLTGIL